MNVLFSSAASIGERPFCLINLQSLTLLLVYYLYFLPNLYSTASSTLEIEDCIRSCLAPGQMCTHKPTSNTVKNQVLCPDLNFFQDTIQFHSFSPSTQLPGLPVGIGRSFKSVVVNLKNTISEGLLHNVISKLPIYIYSQKPFQGA